MQNTVRVTPESTVSAPLHTRTLRNLRNTRDLRAEMLSLAAELAADSQAEGQVMVIESVITEATIHKEWESLLPAIARRCPDAVRQTAGSPRWRLFARTWIDAGIYNDPALA